MTLAVDVRHERIADAQKTLGMKEGFDVGLEMSGSPDAFREMLANMCHGGRIAMLGIPSKEMAINWNTVVFNMLNIQGIYGRRPELPSTAGFEGAGIVEEAGPGLLGRMRVGRRVAVLHGPALRVPDHAIGRDQSGFDDLSHNCLHGCF